MDVTINTLSEVSREVEITTTAQELQPHFEKAYREYGPKVDIKGFRRGKAPLNLIKKLYGDLIEHETLSSIAGKLYRDAVKEKDLRPIGEPVITDMDYKKGEQLRFKVQYDVRPKIELKEYKGIPIEKPVHTVTDLEVENELLRLRRIHSATQEVAQVTDEEHIVTAELQELDSTGVPIIGRKTKNARFYLVDPQLEQPFKDALKSAEVGHEYRVAFEHEHKGDSHSVNAALRVTKAEKVVLPEFDNAFVSKITKDKVSTVEAFRKSLREDLSAYWDEKGKRGAVNALIAELIRRHEFQVPESLTRNVLDSLLDEVRNQYPNKQLPSDFDAEQFYQENRAYAIYQSKWALLREELIKAENVTVEDSDLEALAERESAKIGIDKNRLVNYYKSSDQIKDRLIGDKLIDTLLATAKIREVARQDASG